jgi:cytochrome P450
MVQHGDAFTLNLAGQKMTFVFHPSALRHFFTAPDAQLAFAPAVEQFTQRVFGLPPADFLPKHHLLLATLRHQMVPAALPAHAHRMLPALRRGLRVWPAAGGRMELYAAVQSLLFPAAVEALFGPAFLQCHGAPALQAAFFEFEGGFELAASPVPHLLQPRFRRARAALLRALTASYRGGHFEGSAVGALIQGCGLPPRCVPSMLLAVLWASQANTVPAAFWSVAFLLLPENAGHLAAVRAAVDSPEGSAPTRLVAAACDRGSPPSLCAMEALRLRAPSIDVRVAATDILVPPAAAAEAANAEDDAAGGALPVAVAAGSVVAICPWESHLDGRLYACPASYHPQREGMRVGGSTGEHAAGAGAGGLAGVAFGGGKYRCPGRGFAAMELALVTALIVASFDLELLLLEAQPPAQRGGGRRGFPGDAHGLLPAPRMAKLVGVKVPQGACMVRATVRRAAGPPPPE